ncbi:hypothetical protein QTP88_008033 [Uroleucon formosanum]
MASVQLPTIFFRESATRAVAPKSVSRLAHGPTSFLKNVAGISSAIELQLLWQEPFRSSPEMKVDSPVHKALIDVSTEEPNSLVEIQDAFALDSLLNKCQVDFTIDALELAVESLGISSAVELQPLRRKPFRSSPELSTQSPLYGELETISAELSQTPAPRSDRRKSPWKRSRQFVWKCLVNTARRICFYQGIVNVE